MNEQPFLGMEAVREGRITDYRLRTRYRAVYRNVYVRKETTLTADVRARAAWLWAGGDAVLARLPPRCSAPSGSMATGLPS